MMGGRVDEEVCGGVLEVDGDVAGRLELGALVEQVLGKDSPVTIALHDEDRQLEALDPVEVAGVQVDRVAPERLAKHFEDVALFPASFVEQLEGSGEGVQVLLQHGTLLPSLGSHARVHSDVEVDLADLQPVRANEQVVVRHERRRDQHEAAHVEPRVCLEERGDDHSALAVADEVKAFGIDAVGGAQPLERGERIRVEILERKRHGVELPAIGQHDAFVIADGGDAALGELLGKVLVGREGDPHLAEEAVAPDRPGCVDDHGPGHELAGLPRRHGHDGLELEIAACDDGLVLDAADGAALLFGIGLGRLARLTLAA